MMLLLLLLLVEEEGRFSWKCVCVFETNGGCLQEGSLVPILLREIQRKTHTVKISSLTINLALTKCARLRGRDRKKKQDFKRRQRCRLVSAELFEALETSAGEAESR